MSFTAFLPMGMQLTSFPRPSDLPGDADLVMVEEVESKGEADVIGIQAGDILRAVSYVGTGPEPGWLDKMLGAEAMPMKKVPGWGISQRDFWWIDVNCELMSSEDFGSTWWDRRVWNPVESLHPQHFCHDLSYSLDRSWNAMADLSMRQLAGKVMDNFWMRSFMEESISTQQNDLPVKVIMCHLCRSQMRCNPTVTVQMVDWCCYWSDPNEVQTSVWWKWINLNQLESTVNLAFTCNWSRKFLYMCKLFVWDVCMTFVAVSCPNEFVRHFVRYVSEIYL